MPCLPGETQRTTVTPNPYFDVEKKIGYRLISSLWVFMVVQAGCPDLQCKIWMSGAGTRLVSGRCIWCLWWGVILSLCAERYSVPECIGLYADCLSGDVLTDFSPRLWRKSPSRRVCGRVRMYACSLLHRGWGHCSWAQGSRSLESSLCTGFCAPCWVPVECLEQSITWWSLLQRELPSASLVLTEASQSISPPRRASFPTFSSAFPALDEFALWRTLLKCVFQGRI